MVHIGDSTSEENFEGLPNAQEVAEAWVNEGFEGCWVLAMGTNEAANVAAGSSFTYEDRIASMMATVGGEPVLWVSVKSLETTGPYAESNMTAWDEALLEAFPNTGPLVMTDKDNCTVTGAPPSTA